MGPNGVRSHGGGPPRGNAGPTETTADLAERIRGGDPSAEALLVAEYLPRVRRLILTRTGHRDVVQDLSQDVMVVTLEALRHGRLRRAESLGGYIQGVVRNTVNGYFRLQTARAEVPVDCDDYVVSADDGIESLELRKGVRMGLKRLKPVDRAILYMLVVEGLTQTAIAERLHINPEAVRQRKTRALRRIRDVVRDRLSR